MPPAKRKPFSRSKGSHGHRATSVPDGKSTPRSSNASSQATGSAAAAPTASKGGGKPGSSSKERRADTHKQSRARAVEDSRSKGPTTSVTFEALLGNAQLGTAPQGAAKRAARRERQARRAPQEEQTLEGDVLMPPAVERVASTASAADSSPMSTTSVAPEVPPAETTSLAAPIRLPSSLREQGVASVLSFAGELTIRVAAEAAKRAEVRAERRRLACHLQTRAAGARERLRVEERSKEERQRQRAEAKAIGGLVVEYERKLSNPLRFFGSTRLHTGLCSHAT